MSIKPNSEINEVLAFITGFETGNFPKSLEQINDPVLQIIANKLNLTAKNIATKSLSATADRARFNALYNQSADAIMTLAPPTWKFTGCNSAALKLFKVSSEAEFISLGPWNLAPERQPGGSLSSEKAPEAIMKAMSTGSYFFEWDHADINGKIINCTVLLSKVDLPGESYLQATVRDISQDKFKERELKSIFRDSPMGIVRFDSNFSYITVNPAYEKFIGYSQQELISKSILDLVHPEDCSKTLEKLKKIVTEPDKSTKQLEKRYVHKSGQIIWARVTCQAVINADGKMTFLSIVEDITEKKTNEIETATMLETMADGLVIQDKNGVIESFNPAALSVLGLSEDQLRGRTSMDPNWKAIKQDGSPFPGDQHPAMIALRTGEPIKDVVMGLVLSDHTERWIKINAIPYEGKSGRRVACTFSNVTELFNTQKEIRFVLDSLKIGVWKYNPADQSLFWDKSMYELFDINESDFSGHYQAWESTLTPDSKQKATEELRQALRGENEFDTVFEIETKSKGKRFISGRGQVIRDQNSNPITMYGVNIDITEEVKIKRDLEIERSKSIKNAKLASLGEMSAGIAHEINNPLAIISGSIGLLSKFTNNPEKFELMVGSIEKAIDRISRIVGGLRKFSRSGDKANLKNHKLEQIVYDSLVLTDAKSKQNLTAVTLDFRSQSYIFCDEVEIEQVVVNLISNAIDAVKKLPEKWVKISLYDENQSVVLRVTDSGSGIPKSIHDNLFDPFFTTKEVGEGTGLGLSITKGILDEHKASIEIVVESPNTCFEIRFPKVKEIENGF